MCELELANRRFERERLARKAAEELLEQKSRDLYEAKEEYRQLAERTNTILETAAEGIFTYDSRGLVSDFNRSARQMFGIETPTNLNVHELFVCDTEKNLDLLFEKRDSPIEFHEPIELNGRRPDGSTFVAEIAISLTESGGESCYTALVRDLTKRKLLEAKLSQAQKMESVGQLAAGLAHEINTPIQFIENNIQFLQGAYDDLTELIDLFDALAVVADRNDAVAQSLEKIELKKETADLNFLKEEFPEAIEQTMQGIDMVARIVRAMKDFSQPPSEQKSAHDLNAAIENALAVCANRFRQIASVHKDLSPNLPKLVCFGASINQLLLNVLSNAADALTEKQLQGDGRLVIRTRLVDGHIELVVSDNGPGIPEKIRPRVFDPFFTTKAVGKGMGQGLAYVYDVVVNQHGGSVTVSPSPENGAEFTFTFPVVPVLSSR